MRPRFLLLCILPLTAVSPGDPAADRSSCPVAALVRDTAPRDPAAQCVGPADWYINADRTIWGGTVPEGGWAAGGTGHKTYWVRPQGTQLVISGRRIDAPAPPLKARIPCCYPTGFQIVGLQFPTDGCWEVHAQAGDRELRFVTRVRPATPDPKR
jgi:hypothetical protein